MSDVKLEDAERAAPLLLEVRTERFIDIILALEQAKFEVVALPRHHARYVLRDAREMGKEAV